MSKGQAAEERSHLGRRAFSARLAATLVLSAAPLAARAQAPDRRRRSLIVFFTGSDDRPTGLRAIEPALRGAGWIDSQNYDGVWRIANGDLQLVQRYAQEVVAMAPDLIVTSTTPAVVAVNALTKSIPIVGTLISDPIGNRLSSSFARPDSNVTGTVSNIESLPGKILDIAMDIFPTATRVGFVSVPDDPLTAAVRAPVLDVAQAKNLQLVPADVTSTQTIEPAIAALARERVDFIYLASNSLITTERERVAAHALAAKLPIVYQYRQMVESGGLMSYGPSTAALNARGAYFVDRVLRGAKISDLPLEFPTTFELVVNLKTAKALGITIPEIVMLRATDVIE